VTGFTATRSLSSLTSVQLTWSPAENSNQDSYTITYTGEFVYTSEQKLTANQSPKVVQDLFPGERYTFTVKASSSDKFSNAKTSTVAVCKYMV
jgi:archaellum component FlaF (FlaF/FlaG flagellin family)